MSAAERPKGVPSGPPKDTRPPKRTSIAGSAPVKGKPGKRNK